MGRARLGAVTKVVWQALSATATLVVLLHSAAASEAEGCPAAAAGRAADLTEACHEDQVESLEETEVEVSKSVLLQLDIRHIKASDAATSGDLRIRSGEPVYEASVADRLADEELVQRLSQQEHKVASFTSVIKENNVAISKLLQERHNQTMVAASTEGKGVTKSSVDCAQYPMFCNAKVNCAARPLSEMDVDRMSTRLATADGRANPRSWCLAYPMYATSVQKCIVEGDAVGYAHEMFESQSKLQLLEADAVYCFVAGHCNTTTITPKTTPAEAEAICDRIYGHDQWTNIGWKDFLGVLTRAVQLGTTHSIPAEWNVTSWDQIVALARHESRISAMTACAMGNYHCDVSYCKVNYCDNPVYRDKFGMLAW